MTSERPHQSSLDNPLYYLENFRTVLSWVLRHHADLLTEAETDHLRGFYHLPLASQALLVRLVMRKGPLFRSSRLNYPELAMPVDEALPSLVQGEWIDPAPPLTLEALFSLFTRVELARHFRQRLKALDLARSATKQAMFECLAREQTGDRRLDQWFSDEGEAVIGLRDEALLQRIRLMFFGNLRQDWSEFVLSELGHQRYEYVPFDGSSRAFSCRAEVDSYLYLQQCREALEGDEPLSTVWERMPPQQTNPWLESRRGRLLFSLGRLAEREGDWALALAAYEQSCYGEALVRRLRVMERLGDDETALCLAEQAIESVVDESVRLALQRLIRRLSKRLQRPLPTHPSPPKIPGFRLTVAWEEGVCVESAAAGSLEREAGRVFYVENGLFNGLFALLCWPALYAPLSGAFFHPFHAAPADLYREDFVRRREALFAECLAALDSEAYLERIRRTFQEKQGITSPFLSWPLLTRELLELALEHIPAAHLRRIFDRMLEDLRQHRSGLPDLIQFQPQAPGYRLIEVKGPGDRLQDNQRRWFHYCLSHQIPVALCQVAWERSE